MTHQIDRLLNRITALEEALRELRDAVQQIAYPKEHARQLTLATAKAYRALTPEGEGK